MPVITRALLRKRSEHNEGIISTMQELTLHQEELENINEVLGLSCRKIKILMLQNNIISRMENLVHLKELEYLNLALNNVKKIEGLQNCEFLNKIDLTVNFVDVDELEESIDHLISREHLKDLYMMGNPCQANWEGFASFVIAKLPQLQTLDGTEITRSLQILARQKLPDLEIELRQLAVIKRRELAVASKLKDLKNIESDIAAGKKTQALSGNSGEALDVAEEAVIEEDREQLTENTPEVRQEIYRELAQQKKEKDDRDKANGPKERDYDNEQLASIEDTRLKEKENGEKEIRQKNEGGWEFKWDEESRQSFISLEVFVSRHLDSSLMDVDVHPTYVSVIIKSKVLRLRLPAEVKSSEAKCQRSKTTGSLLIIMPKVDPKENSLTIRGDVRAREKTTEDTVFRSFDTEGIRIGAKNNKSTTEKTIIRPKKLSLQEQILQDALANDLSNNVNHIPPTDLDEGGISSISSSHLLGFETKTPYKSSTLSSIIRKPPIPSDVDSSFSLDNIGEEGNEESLVSHIEELD